MNKVIVQSSGKALFLDKEYPCALGKGGVKAEKREGDGATPSACMRIRKVLYRVDRQEKPVTALPVEAINMDDGWCDDVNDAQYNRQVKLPYPASHEELWREDNVYDVIAVLGWNDDPPIPGKGSAIFLHVARPGFTPTAGCIALALPDLLEILAAADRETEICTQE